MRERRFIAIGAMVLFVVLAAGPRTLRAAKSLAEASKSTYQELASPRNASSAGSLRTGWTLSSALALNLQTPPKCSADTWSCEAWGACSDDGRQTRVCSINEDCPGVATPSPDTTRNCTPPPLPLLSILQPKAGSSQASPFDISAHVSNVTAVGMIFEIRDANGAISHVQASPTSDSGVWNAPFSGPPGAYTLSISASFVDGSVKDFPDQRGFRLIESAAAPASTVSASATELLPSSLPTAPTVELLPPAPQKTLFDASVLMYARVKDAVPDQLVFVVDAEGGGETIVLGVPSDNGDYWQGYFEGADGDYTVRARAHVPQGEFFSDPRAFSLIR